MTDLAYVTQLLNEARDLVDAAADLGTTIAGLLLGSARSAGLDPAAYAPLTGAALVLGASQVLVYTAGNGGHAHPDDICFLADVSDAEDDARDLLAAAGTLADKVTAALDTALADAELADDEDSEDYADGVADGLDIAARIRLCQTALGVLGELDRRLRHAIGRLAAVPAVLGQTYEAVYSLLRSGGLMPHEGRWITGEDDPGTRRISPELRRRLAAVLAGQAAGAAR